MIKLDISFKKLAFIFFIALITSFVLQTFISMNRYYESCNRLNAKMEADWQKVAASDPVWLRLKKAGFKDYRIDTANRLITIRY